MRLRDLPLLGCALAAGGAAPGLWAAAQSFPRFAWGEARVVREEKVVTVRGLDGNTAFAIYANPRVALPRP